MSDRGPCFLPSRDLHENLLAQEAISERIQHISNRARHLDSLLLPPSPTDGQDSGMERSPTSSLSPEPPLVSPPPLPPSGNNSPVGVTSPVGPSPPLPSPPPPAVLDNGDHHEVSSVF